MDVRDASRDVAVTLKFYSGVRWGLMGSRLLVHGIFFYIWRSKLGTTAPGRYFKLHVLIALIA